MGTLKQAYLEWMSAEEVAANRRAETLAERLGAEPYCNRCGNPKEDEYITDDLCGMCLQEFLDAVEKD